MSTYHVKTYGCQMNYSDSERVEAYLEALGYEKEKDINKAELIMINTCSIRQKAEDKVVGQVRNLAKEREQRNLKIGITGCMVRQSSSRKSKKKDKLFNLIGDDLDIALRIEELPQLAELIREIDPSSTVEAVKEESLEDYFMISPNYASKAQAFVPVSNGCDKFCTYCIVPFSRGRERSRSIEEIVEECAKLVENGCIEITLVGQTVNSFGFSLDDKRTKKFAYLGSEKEPFVYLLEELDKLKEKGLKRVRFTSPHPRDMSDQLIDAMATLETQMPYLHLPVQAGDNRTLKRMNRTYTVERYREIIQKLREKIPDISISTDIIVGFCDESEEEFETTYKFFEEMAFEHGFISRYSDRKGTFANKYLKDNIAYPVKRDRWNRLNDLLEAISQKAHERFRDKVVHVLVEGKEGDTCIGRSEHFKTVEFEARKDLVGKIVPVKITDPQPWRLIGEIV